MMRAGERRKDSRGPSRGREEVEAIIVEAGLSLIDRVGVEQISVRRISREAHYSASAIAYHVTPIDRFVTRLWFTLHERVEAAFVDARTEEQVFLTSSRVLMTWADAHPKLADFYANFTPKREHFPTDRDTCGVPGEGWRHASDEVRDLWWYFVRRGQAAFGLALTSPRTAATTERLADDYERLAGEWATSLSPLLVPHATS